MNQTRIFLDTNVLVYAHDSSSQHHIISANLLSAVFTGRFQAVLSEQNLLELYRILTNPIAMKGNSLSTSQVKNLIESTYLGGQFQIIYPTQAVLRQVLELAVQKNITSAKIFDLRLAAIALSTQVKFLITFNIKDFTGINGLTPLSPYEIFTYLDT
ncbi:MAG: PIN domain-containing protein [Coleofasciculaceae cyanobacterium SM2_1_6]|nr:PIN domain-containing protein [Coleofasciculaceae cyanobacterium SM2_1_6]